MSLAETQQIMALLTEISQLLDGINVKSTKLNNDLPRTRQTMANFRTLERIALRYLVIARRMGLPEDQERAAEKLSQMIVLVNMLYMSFNMMTTGPLGVVMGFAGMLLAGMSFGNIMEGY